MDRKEVEKIRRTMAIVGCVGLLWIGACSGKKATGPQPTLLSAIPLTRNPVLWSSPLVPATRANDSDYVIQLDTILRSRTLQQLDIRLEFERQACTEDVHVWDPHGLTWRAMELSDTASTCYEVVSGSYLLSSAVLPARQLIANNRVTIRAANSRWLNYQVLDLDRHYQRILLPRSVTPGALAWNENLYIATQYPEATVGARDSLQVYSPIDGFVRSSVLSFRPKSMTWSPLGLWMLHGGEGKPTIISLCDSTGLEQSQFTMSGYFFGGPLMWYRDSLWTNDFRGLAVLDVQASIDSGYSIVSRRYGQFRQFQGTATSLATDGDFILMMDYRGPLQAYSYEGQFVFELPVPLNWGSPAWDGQALWLIHLGKNGASESRWIVSRFTLD